MAGLQTVELYHDYQPFPGYRDVPGVIRFDLVVVCRAAGPVLGVYAIPWESGKIFWKKKMSLRRFLKDDAKEVLIPYVTVHGKTGERVTDRNEKVVREGQTRVELVGYSVDNKEILGKAIESIMFKQSSLGGAFNTATAAERLLKSQQDAWRILNKKV